MLALSPMCQPSKARSHEISSIFGRVVHRCNGRQQADSLLDSKSFYKPADAGWKSPSHRPTISVSQSLVSISPVFQPAADWKARSAGFSVSVNATVAQTAKLKPSRTSYKLLLYLINNYCHAGGISSKNTREFVQSCLPSFSERIASADFVQIARQPDFPNAVIRALSRSRSPSPSPSRNLPLRALIAGPLTMRPPSQQVQLEVFFSLVSPTPELDRVDSDLAFAKAHDRFPHLPRAMTWWLRVPLPPA
ncbi:MAG: hypothetical protein H7242_19335 [Microbacteriaceae bacterium]|nr:hypothetical protein [Burkholderiaceae bacterium]